MCIILQTCFRRHHAWQPFLSQKRWEVGSTTRRISFGSLRRLLEVCYKADVLKTSQRRARLWPTSCLSRSSTCAQPFRLRLINMDHTCFTQSHVNDSFPHEKRPVVEMVGAVGELKQQTRSRSQQPSGLCTPVCGQKPHWRAFWGSHGCVDLGRFYQRQGPSLPN